MEIIKITVSILLEKILKRLFSLFIKIFLFLFLREKRKIILERYILINKFNFHKKEENAPIYRLKLDKRFRCYISNLFLDKYVCFDKLSDNTALGWIDFYIRTNEVILHGYALIYTCTNFLIAPGNILLKSENSWKENITSNQFNILIVSQKYEMTRNKKFEILEQLPEFLHKLFLIYLDIYESLLLIEQNFEVPKNYTGPFITKRYFLYKKGIGLILSISHLNNGEKVIYILKKYSIKSDTDEIKDEFFPFKAKEGSYWEYLVYNCNITSRLNIKYIG